LTSLFITRNLLLPLVLGRMRNISAVLHGEGLDFVKAYKPAKNLGEAVRVRIWRAATEA
jgi:hypothetical protein